MGYETVSLAQTEEEMIAYTAHFDGHVPRSVDNLSSIHEPRGYGDSCRFYVGVALGSSMTFPIRQAWDVDWRNTLLCGIGRDLLPPHGYRPRRTIFEYPFLHKLCLPQLRCPAHPPTSSIGSSFRGGRFQTAWASTFLRRPLRLDVAVTSRPAVFGQKGYAPTPRHIFEGIVRGTGLVLPAGPVDDRFVDDRDRVEVIPERKVGYGGRWQDPSPVFAIAVCEVVL